LHTEYSIVDGLVRISELSNQVIERGMSCVAITDQCNLFAMVKFYKAACKAGIKPIFGADVWVEDDSDNEQLFRLVLLCQNQKGYQQLTRLISRSYLEGQKLGKPIIKKSWLFEANEGLIVLSGGRLGDVGVALLSQDINKAQTLAREYQQHFGDRFYIELMRTGRVDEDSYLHFAVELAASTDIPVVASNDVCFTLADDFEAHEARVCINGGWTLDNHKRPKLYHEQQYLRSASEMVELFSDIPEAIENTVEIAKRCNLELSLGKNYLPEFPVPAGMT
ncbi:unnamed protein product, partial [marine sediment metagenome]